MMIEAGLFIFLLINMLLSFGSIGFTKDIRLYMAGALGAWGALCTIGMICIWWQS